MSTRPTQDPERSMLFISNRWVNTIYCEYGIIKQRVLLAILQELQVDIKNVMRGKKVTQYNFPKGGTVALNLDLSQIVHYNNYHQARKAITEMSSTAIKIYADPTYRSEQYISEPLLAGFTATKDRKQVTLLIKSHIAELLLHVDYKNTKSAHYTKFDKETIGLTSSKYMQPLYMLICSWSEKGGFTMGIDELRRRLQVEEKYQGFDNFHRFVLKHIQKELQIFGAYGFNFDLVKSGKTVTKIKFKIFANKKFDYNHVWLRIQRALTQELPYFVRFTEEQREQFNYLLTGEYDLDKVHSKLQYIHKALVKRKEGGDPAKSPFIYTIRSIHEQFPPPG